jgi:hypothetical protein
MLKIAERIAVTKRKYFCEEILSYSGTYTEGSYSSRLTQYNSSPVACGVGQKAAIKRPLLLLFNAHRYEAFTVIQDERLLSSPTKQTKSNARVTTSMHSIRFW